MRIRIALALVLTVALPRAAGASAVTVLGHSDGHACFLNAATGSSSVASLNSCRKALAGQMSSRDEAATLVNMGIILNALARMDEAVTAFNRALTISPELPEAVLSRGNSHYLRRDYDLAIADYERSLEYGVRDEAAAHFNHGMAHGKKKNYHQAAASYQRALELKPQFRRAEARLYQLKSRGLTNEPRPRPGS